MVTLTNRINSGDLPPGVTDRAARRALLEHRVRAFTAIRDNPASAPDERETAAKQLADSERALIKWHTEGPWRTTS